MLISVEELSKYWGIKPRSVLHIGGHRAEEAESYEKNNWLPVVWVEAQPILVEELKKNLNPQHHQIICAAVWKDSNIDMTLKVTSNSLSTSLLEFGTHKKDYPEIDVISEIKVQTKRIDELFTEKDIPNFVSLDIQGAEGPALQGFGSLIDKIDYIYTEINFKNVYDGCMQIKEFDKLLFNLGFKRAFTRKIFFKGWGDALYIRRDLIHLHQNVSVVPVIRNMYLRLFYSLVKLKSIYIFLSKRK